jgi:hypothetical protein
MSKISRQRTPVYALRTHPHFSQTSIMFCADQWLSLSLAETRDTAKRVETEMRKVEQELLDKSCDLARVTGKCELLAAEVKKRRQREKAGKLP